ncbi:MAG: oxygen-independent coproporphyrinogen III oxidase [Rhodospirillaceae bacterium]|nr:oxygen-independent coproporphyrinogen III oxidase [Rhodospirillaceae bacterium]
MPTELIAKYDARIPRYTSYPTAPHFHAGITAEMFRGWLSALAPTQELSLYLHIPYCEVLCWFCGCHTRGAPSYGPVANYLSSLKQEISMVASHLGKGTRAPQPIRYLHFGGGSPSILSAPDFEDLMGMLRDAFSFHDTTEIAIELDPRTTQPDLIASMARCGVRRASVGVQDLTPTVQKAIHRIQPFSMVERTITGLRDVGINHINVDLMYGLPHQTQANIRETIEKILPLAPDRLAVFGYAHVPWMRKLQNLIPEAALPGAPERWAQACLAREMLLSAGYVEIGFDHYAHPSDDLAIALSKGTLNRNFQGYTSDNTTALIGMGASGISELPQGYAVNDADIAGYAATIATNTFATKRGIAVSVEDKARRAIIERLMCDLRVDVAATATLHGVDISDLRNAYARLSEMENDGLLTRSGDIVAMTEAGRPFVRSACAAFDRYLVAGEQRHSRSV